MDKTLIEIQDISAGYENNIVLKNVSLSVYEHDFLGIIGPNGGGKTTLIKIILSLLKPFTGKITFLGDRLKQNIGYMPQINHIDRKFPILVSEAISSGLMGVKNLTSQEKRDKVNTLIKQMGIEDIATFPIGTLSGGQMQRVLLARAIVNNPALLLLDEPNSYVDKRFEQYFYEHLRKINNNTAIVLVSHDIGSVLSNVKNIACVNGTLHYHPGTDIDGQWLEEQYSCPLDLIAHGELPHRILKKH
ncbi:MAG: ABC transporter ATP-binding protein [Dysgonamonadaceae bacterium]|jgi:zinc transport system ATP-binding protein|nr:ABC transporter ATP-binding protein [Dysgonamonadaceae bacterium]